MMVEVISIRNLLTESALIIVGVVAVSAVSSTYRLQADVLELQNTNTQLRLEVSAYEAAIYNETDVQSNDISTESNEEESYLGTFDITYYCSCDVCCGGSGSDKVGVTKSGVMAEEGVTIAVDTDVIPIGSEVYIDGIGIRIAQDTGGAIKGNKIDIYVKSHEKALQLGRHKAAVFMIGR